MPNIEIYGIHRDAIGVFEYGRQIQRIIDQIRDVEFIDDIVFTLIESVVVDKNVQKIKPFLRICSTDQTEIDVLVKKLKPLKNDIETMLLTGFIPSNL